MERQIEINLKRLWELAKQGKSAEEIMRELDITEIAVLKNALEGLMREKGETVTVPGLVGRASIDGEYTASGERIPRDMPAKPEK